MRFDEPLGHVAVVDGLLRAARARRLAHALLFEGPEGVGKHLASEWLAFGLLCASGPVRPCGSCGPCKRLRSGIHPDAFVLDAEAEGEEQIKISRITYRPDDPRENVTEFLSLKPMEGGWRVVLIRDAHRLNEPSQNALLKTLEEPGQGALLVLSTSRPDLLLETTRSRCLRVGFEGLSRDATAALLVSRGLSPGDAGLLARWSAGAPGAALSMHERGALALRAVLERVLAGEADALGAAGEVQEIEGEFPGKTPAAASRARARAFLDLALAVLADLRRRASGVDPARLAHGDLRAAPGEAVLNRVLDRCLQARQDVEANLSPETAVERALLALERLSPSAIGSGSRNPDPRNRDR